MKILTVTLLITSSLIGFAAASTTADIKCVQQGLLDAGYDPNGVDGAIGNGTKKALANWVKENPNELAPITRSNAAHWCRLFKANVAQSEVAAGTYRAVFTFRKNNKSENRCGILDVNYENGHFYRFGLCNKNLDNIEPGAQISETAVIDLNGKLMNIIDATYDILDIKNGDLIGQWELGEERNNFLTFKRLSND